MNRTWIVMVLVAIALAMPVASAADWKQFQKDEISIGWTTDIGPLIKPQLAWSHNIGSSGHAGIEGTPIVGDGKVFVLNHSGWLHAFHAKTGEPIWDPVFCNLNPGDFEVSTPAYNDGIVYVATSKGDLNTGHGRVTAIYAGNGTIREQADLGEGLSWFQLNTPVTYSDGRIYVGNWKGGAAHTDDNGTYYCLDASNVSDIIWNRTAPYCTGYYWAGAAIVGEYILFGDDRANVTCLYKDNGTLVDYINVSEQCGCNDPVEEIRSSIRYESSTGRIYFTAKKADDGAGDYGTGHVYAVAFNAATGYLGGSNGAIGTGVCAWNNSINYSTSTPVYYNGRIYVGGGHKMGDPEPGKMCCLHETNGSLIWQWYNATAGRVQASPALSIVDGHTYIHFTTNVGTAQHQDHARAYCLEDMGDTFETTWVYNPPDDNYILQGMAISDGMVYFGTDDGYVYALQEETPYDLDIDTSVALNGDVNISWSGNASRRYDIYITDAYPNFGTTPAATGITVNHWIDADASDYPEQRYYKVAYNGRKPGIVSDTVGYYNATAKFGPEPYFTVLSVPHMINATDINDVLKYNHAPGQRLNGAGMPWERDYVRAQNPTTGYWQTSRLSATGTWDPSVDLPSDIGFGVYIKPGHTVPTNMVYRMLMRDTLGDLMEFGVGMPNNLNINTSITLNGDVNISWGGVVPPGGYDIYIANSRPNFGTTPAATGITVNHWIDANAGDHPKQRYYKVADNGINPGVVTAGYYNTTVDFGYEPDFMVLAVPCVVTATGINDVLKYNHAPGQRLDGSGMPWQRDYVRAQNPTTGDWQVSRLSATGTWDPSVDLPSDIGFRVYIKPGHALPTNVVYRMLME